MSRDADMGNGERVIATLEHSDERLDGSYKGRADAVGKCARGAKQFDENNFPYFVFHSFSFSGSMESLALMPKEQHDPKLFAPQHIHVQCSSRPMRAVAWDRGFPAFAVQDGGWCASEERILSRFGAACVRKRMHTCRQIDKQTDRQAGRQPWALACASLACVRAFARACARLRPRSRGRVRVFACARCPRASSLARDHQYGRGQPGVGGA